jgi:aryl-alcohol dehydrogenase-like predicted oxidoreductase
LATKFGYAHDAARRELTGVDITPAGIRRACEASLLRLGTDYIDLYQLHVWSIPADQADDVFSTLDELRAEGQIRAYGWGTGEPETPASSPPARAARRIWARSDRTIPSPGLKTSDQVEENARAMDFGPLTSAQMDEIDNLLRPPAECPPPGHQDSTRTRLPRRPGCWWQRAGLPGSIAAHFGGP